ncbi:MAG: type III pantothenate kinase [Actinomycetota bacterium]|nr:type III pantothenate kinase [Actinomycetota bacterium]
MLLAIDVGNTQTVIGLFEDSAGSGEPDDHWRIATNPERTADEHVLLLNQFLAQRHVDLQEAITGLAVASVVPRVTATLRRMAHRYLRFDPVVIEPGTRTGMPILYDNPKEVGADRIADAVAAWDLYGGPTIVVDFGTAITVEVISEAGEYLGGAIFPGIEVALDGLYSRAAGLRRVELGEPPPSVIGKNTANSIRAGAVYGYAAMVDGLCRRVEDEVGPCTVVSTGGLGSLIAPLSDRIEHHEPWLMLHGLRLVYQRNQAP